MSSEDGHKPRETRVTINKDFESFDEFIREYVTNISKTGAFVKRASPLPVGTEVNLKFTVIVDSVETIEGVGKVVRVQHDPPGMGVVFTSISQYSQHLLERMLTQQRPHDA
jgi:Tfp pilus assembly protein PilZ